MTVLQVGIEREESAVDNAKSFAIGTIGRPECSRLETKWFFF